MAGLAILAGGIYLGLRPTNTPTVPAPLPQAAKQVTKARPEQVPIKKTKPPAAIPKPPPIRPPEAKVDHFQAGLKAYKTQEWEKAALHWQKFLKTNPNRMGLRRSLAKVLIRLGRKEEAKAQYWVILKKQPRDASAKAALAQLSKAKP